MLRACRTCMSQAQISTHWPELLGLLLIHPSMMAEQWLKEYGEASKIMEDISGRVGEMSSMPPSGPATQRFTSAIRRKVTILSTRLDSLESLLPNLSSAKPPITEKEFLRRQDMLVGLRAKANQVASTLKMSNFGNRSDLLGDESRHTSEINRTTDLDNHGLVGLQQQIMREQDKGLRKLEETVLSVKHIAFAVKDELHLQERLIDNLDQDVDRTASRLEMAQRKLAKMGKRVKSTCSCTRLLLMVMVIVLLALVTWAMIKFL